MTTNSSLGRREFVRFSLLGATAVTVSPLVRAAPGHNVVIGLSQYSLRRLFQEKKLAISMGKHVFVQKPMTRSVGETRELLLAARRHGVITQMGNQGHAGEGVQEWINACKGGPLPGSNFEYAAPLTEMVQLGNVALCSRGRKLEWNAANLRIRNVPEFEWHLRIAQRAF